MTPEQMVAAMRRWPWFFLGGVAIFVCGIFTGGFLCMTGLLGVMVGASIVSFRSGLFHRGMWVLGALFWFLGIFLYAVLSYLHIYQILDHCGSIEDFVSLALATWLLGVQSRFLLTATILNWQSSHKRFEHDHAD